jgi:hypothetical protein
VNQRLVPRMELLPGYAGGFVFVSPCYLVLRWLLRLVALRARSNEWKELKIVVRFAQRTADARAAHSMSRIMGTGHGRQLLINVRSSCAFRSNVCRL